MFSWSPGRQAWANSVELFRCPGEAIITERSLPITNRGRADKPWQIKHTHTHKSKVSNSLFPNDVITLLHRVYITIRQWMGQNMKKSPTASRHKATQSKTYEGDGVGGGCFVASCAICISHAEPKICTCSRCHSFYRALVVKSILLTNFSLEIPKRVIGKQSRPISECGVWSGSLLFANSLAIFL